MKPATGRAEAHPPEDRVSREHRDRPSTASFTRAPLVDVRRLAAVDMHGSRGTTRRRRLVLTEFALGATLGPAIALATLVTASSTFAVVLGVWILGATLNYVPLAGHAIRLSRPGALVAELAGVDVGAELRRYTVKQFWVAVPLLFVVLAATQRRPDG